MERLPEDGSLTRLPAILAGRIAPGGSVLVGIDGGAGSGKTTFARWLVERVSAVGTPASAVHLDNFFRPVAERIGLPSPLAVIDDIDWRRLRDEVILPLGSGEGARFQLYDWPTDSLQSGHMIPCGGVTLIDGVTALRYELRDYYDLRIWLSCPRDLRVSRLSRREGSSEAELRRWLPSEDQYVAAHFPRDCAHIVLESSSGDEDEAGGCWSVVRWSLPDFD